MTQKRTFRIFVRARDAKTVYLEGQEPGVVAYQDLEYNLEPEVYESPMFIHSLVNKEREFLEDCFSTDIKEIKE